MTVPRHPIWTKEAVQEAFTYHRPFGDQPHRYEAIREAARQLAFVFIANCPLETAETTLALRRLQEAVMWANASIAVNGYGVADAETISEKLREADGPVR